MDKLSGSGGLDFLGEDLEEESEERETSEDGETREENREDPETPEDREEAFEVIYEQAEMESLYKDYRDIREEPETFENQYFLSKKMERDVEIEHKKLDLEIREEGEYTKADEGDVHKKTDFLKIEYTEPMFFNEQLTYKSVFMENEGASKTVYELTLEASQKNGMDIKISYDENTRTFYLDSMDGMEDGTKIDGDRAYLEFWVKDGETNEYRIGVNSIDQEHLKKGDRVEWRLATERESSCGGGGYAKSQREKEMDEILMYPNNENPIKGYVPGLGTALERDPFFYMDFGLNIAF